MYKVLIVDDSKADVDGIVKYISWDKLGCEVAACAFDGNEGFKKALEIKPDIIITDISMPLLNGIEMARSNKETPKNVKFVFISCFDSVDNLKQAIDIQVSSFILKPIKLDELFSALQSIVKKLDEEKKYDTMKFDLENQLSKNKELLKSRFVLDSIMSSDVDLKTADYMDIGVFEPYVMLVAVCDNRSSLSYDVIRGNMAELKNIINKYFLKPDFLVDIDLGKLGLFISDEMPYSEILKKCDDVQKEFKLSTGHTISIYAKLDKTLASDFANVYKTIDSYIISYYGFLENQIIIVDNCDFFAKLIGSDKLHNLSKELINIIDYGASDKLNEFLNSIFKKSVLKNECYLKSMCFLIINTLSDILKDRNENLSDIFGDELVLRRKISNISNVANIKMWMYNIINFVKEHFEKNTGSDNKYFYMANLLERYIDDNFENDTVLTEAASNLGISVNYANTIFKKYKGDTMFSYLITVRMERAKYLIENTSLQVKDIAAMTGYTTAQYFSKAFKKYVGMTPAEYKSRIKEE